MIEYVTRRRRCPHCRSSALRAHCAKCNREMCEDCISIGELGNTCGLCKDREDAQAGYAKYLEVVKINPLDFEEWYDKHG